MAGGALAVQYTDLRGWLALVDGLGEVRTVRGAHWDLELGTITDLFQRRMGLPALLFDDIAGYPSGYRVLTNTLTSDRRIALTLGLPPDAGARGIIDAWRRFTRGYPTQPPRAVADGPVNARVQTGDAVNLLAFPSPRWHHKDGGRYIGTGGVVIQRDPDSGWVNLGVYRVMVHDERHAGVYISPGKHGRLILERYWAQGRPCPIAVSVGHDPLLFFVGGLEIPYGVGEYDVAGGLRGAPVEVIESEVTGLPVPASAELVIEGEVHPGEERSEGPFGEWLGYYAGGSRPAPVIRVLAVRHREQPIILGNLPAKPPNDDTYYRGILRSAMVWDELEAAGIPGVTGVWSHEAGGGRMFLIVAIRQMYAGHAKQAGTIAMHCHAGAYANRYVVVVDDDVDPMNMNDVIWAMCSRVDPREDVEIFAGRWSTPLDPMAYPPERRNRNARVLIDATRPHGREFPEICMAPADYQREIVARWRDRLPEIAD
ncbi:MAG: UbiD family decarboxylase [Armatimonadota bacterium]|nr:UbiD family decarboxylase [Armatimonadota bacterium]